VVKTWWLFCSLLALGSQPYYWLQRKIYALTRADRYRYRHYHQWHHHHRHDRDDDDDHDQS